MDDISVYCGKCGTLLQLVKVRGRGCKICPHCYPKKAKEIKSRPSNLTGKPCNDRGVCKPGECVEALDCDDGRMHRRKGL